jgi:UDPglucose 6-dehydrogenase
LQEGKAVENFFRPDRIVLGVEAERSRIILEELYRPFSCPVVSTNLATAELIKHAANAFLAAKVSFINVVADLCDSVGADVKQVARGIGLDPRIGPGFLNAGIGFGGYCLPKDLRAFVYLAEEHGVESALLKAIEEVNQRRISMFLRIIRSGLWVLRGKTIGILGVAFKPGTDDIREAPPLAVMKELLREGARLQVYDPQAMPKAMQTLPSENGRLRYCPSAYEAARDAHALVVLTEWDEFASLDLSRLAQTMEVPLMIDGRNLFEPDQVRAAGFEYLCIGRNCVPHLNAETNSVIKQVA